MRWARALLLMMTPLISGCGPSVVYRTIAGPVYRGCGEFDWDVQFSLDDAPEQAGFIVQQVTVTTEIFTCEGTRDPVVTSPLTWWEAWPVGANVISDVRWVDHWHFDRMDHHRGSWSVQGDARFFPTPSLPPDFIPRNPGTGAGALPSTLTEPAGWRDSGSKPLLRSVKVDHFDCCEGGQTKITIDGADRDLIVNLRPPPAPTPSPAPSPSAAPGDGGAH